jgi:hypothetical protein
MAHMFDSHALSFNIMTLYYRFSKINDRKDENGSQKNLKRGVDQIHLSQNRNFWQSLLNMVIHFWVLWELID